MVRAKVKCWTASPKVEGQAQIVSFGAVCNAENKSWADATPGLSLNITIKNPAAQVFEPGKEYYLDFTEVPASPAEGIPAAPCCGQ